MGVVPQYQKATALLSDSRPAAAYEQPVTFWFFFWMEKNYNERTAQIPRSSAVSRFPIIFDPKITLSKER